MTLPGAAIRESIGDLKQRAQEQIGRLRVETGERDQTAQIGQMMDLNRCSLGCVAIRSSRCGTAHRATVSTGCIVLRIKWSGIGPKYRES